MKSISNRGKSRGRKKNKVNIQINLNLIVRSTSFLTDFFLADSFFLETLKQARFLFAVQHLFPEEWHDLRLPSRKHNTRSVTALHSQWNRTRHLAGQICPDKRTVNLLLHDLSCFRWLLNVWLNASGVKLSVAVCDMASSDATKPELTAVHLIVFMITGNGEHQFIWSNQSGCRTLQWPPIDQSPSSVANRWITGNGIDVASLTGGFENRRYSPRTVI